MAERTPVVDLTELREFGVFLAASRRMDGLLEAALSTEVGVSNSWFELLLGIAEAPDQRLLIGELGRKLTLTSGGVTRFVDRVEAAGLVTREPSSTDRRALFVTLTERGREIFAHAVDVHRQIYREAFVARLTPAQQSALATALPRIGHP